jgi:hypothetical protein
MVEYESDHAIQEIQDEMYRKEEERPRGALSKIDQRTKFWIAIGAGITLLLIWTEKISIKTGVIILVIGAIILWLMSGNDPKREELTWIECMIRINDLLKFLQKHPIGDIPQVPQGEVHVRPIGRKQWYEGQAFKRSFAVDIYDKIKDATEMFFVEVDVFTGDIITFKSAPEGVYGDETKDIKLMPTYDMLINKRRDQYLNKGTKVR